MGRTSVDIDDHLIEQARKLIGATSNKKTIERALLEVVRREEIRALAYMDGLNLSNEQVMAGAWCRSEATYG